jgi:transposase
MGRALSGDLRKRVIVAIEGGLSTRAAARRFSIGIATAGAWYRSYRRTGSVHPRKQGQPSGSKLDAHEAFILSSLRSKRTSPWLRSPDSCRKGAVCKLA